MKWEPISSQDRQIIARQIQREPRNLHGIARRCQKRCPQVTVNYPLLQQANDAQFFPTVFWLTCPEAVRQISRMEDQGFIQHIQKQVHANQMLSEVLAGAHQEYVYIRRSLLDPGLRIQLSQQKLLQNMENVGIGGTADLKGVKCLHMHYAHFLATRNNPIGELVDKMIKVSSSDWQCTHCHQQHDLQPAGVAK